MTGADEPREAARAALVVLRSRVDRHFDDAMERSIGQMRCAAGCEECCHVRLSVFTVEAERIRDALHRLDPRTRARIRSAATDPARADRCPMLQDGRCAIYDERPLICRSHGLPVKIEVPPPARVDHCPLNFRQARPAAESVLRLEAINQPLAVMAQMYDGEGDRVALAELAATLSG